MNKHEAEPLPGKDQPAENRLEASPQDQDQDTDGLLPGQEPQEPQEPPPQSRPSPWRPLATPAFAAMWSAALLSNTGTWMQQVGAAWLMTSLEPSPLIVSLVQAATTGPIFLFALAAGALADIVDRRRLLIVVQSVMAAVALTLGIIVYSGLITPWLLLAFTFVLGTGAAFFAPSWQALVPHLVPRSDLPAAIALNSAGFNASRAVGPALAGVLIGVAGVASTFVFNGLSFLGVIVALTWWTGGRPRPRSLPAERFFAAIRTGLRYGRESPPLRATLIRAVAFFVCASAYWALLPLLVRVDLGGSAEHYGIVLGSIGAGAVAGAAVLSQLRDMFGTNRLVAAGTVGTAAALVLFAIAPRLWVATAAGALAGLSWVTAVASLNLSAQLALPDWMRGRGLSLYQMTMFGALAGGSVAWGRIAGATGVPEALAIAAAGSIALMLLTLRWTLGTGETADLTPAQPWPEPVVAQAIGHDRGPVLVTVEYRVARDQVQAFVAAMDTLRGSRRRGGASGWGLFEDAAEPGLFVECFLVDSWVEHLRQHERVTEADRVMQRDVLRYHRGDAAPRVRHLLSPSRLSPTSAGRRRR